MSNSSMWSSGDSQHVPCWSGVVFAYEPTVRTLACLQCSVLYTTQFGARLKPYSYDIKQFLSLTIAQVSYLNDRVVIYDAQPLYMIFWCFPSIALLQYCVGLLVCIRAYLLEKTRQYQVCCTSISFMYVSCMYCIFVES